MAMMTSLSLILDWDACCLPTLPDSQVLISVWALLAILHQSNGQMLILRMSGQTSIALGASYATFTRVNRHQAVTQCLLFILLLPPLSKHARKRTREIDINLCRN